MHVDTEHGFSGGEVQVFLLMEGLRQHGIEQVLVAPKGSASSRIARERGFAVREIALRNPFDLWSVWRLAGLLRDAALVHLHTGKAAWLGSLAGRLARCPVVITRRMDRRVKRSLRTRFAYRDTARAVVAISPAVRQCLIDGGVPAASIEIVGDALDPSRIVSQRGRAAVRAELQLGDAQLAILTLAQLMHRKGIDVLLRALAHLRREGGDDGGGSDLRLFVAGDGPEAEPLATLARELDLGDAVRFLGRRTDAGDLLAAADLFVLPSRQEGLGVAALEALGAGVPVVATNVGGLGDLIVDGVCGLLVPPDEPAPLAAAIARLRGDAALRARFAAAGPARVDEGFRPEGYVARHLAIYGRALAR